MYITGNEGPENEPTIHSLATADPSLLCERIMHLSLANALYKWQLLDGNNRMSRHNVPSDWVVLHASWTTNMTAKIEKFGWLNEWYTTCVAGKKAK